MCGEREREQEMENAKERMRGEDGRRVMMWRAGQAVFNETEGEWFIPISRPACDRWPQSAQSANAPSLRTAPHSPTHLPPAYSSFIYFKLGMHLCVCFHVFVPVQDRMGRTVQLNKNGNENNLFKTNDIFLINVGFISSIIFRLIFHM